MMTRIFSFAIAASLAIGIASADEGESLPAPSIYEAHPHRLYFGLPQLLWLQYDTNISNVHVQDNRLFTGIMFGYEYLKSNTFYAGIDILSTGANSNFHATTQGYDVSQHNNESGLAICDIRFGYTIGAGPWMLSPYVGIGNYLVGEKKNRGLWEFMPYYALGLKTKYVFSENFDAGLNVKTTRSRNFMNKKFKTASYGKATSSAAGWGGVIGVPLTVHFGPTRQWEFQAEPYVGKLLFSETQNLYGVNLLFGYHF